MLTPAQITAARNAYFNDIAAAAAAWHRFIGKIENGILRLGIDVTEDELTDARRRHRDAKALIQSY